MRTTFRCALIGLALAIPAAIRAQGGLTADPRIAQLLTAVSEQRLQATIEKLVSFRTRNTLSSATDPVAGIGAARQWILNELKGYSPRLQVSFDRHVINRTIRLINRTESRL